MTRTRLRILASLGVVASFCAVPHVAGAQDGTSEYAPSDVLLLLDTSGSMARTTVRAPGDPATYGLPQCGAFPASNPISFEASANFSSGNTPADRWAILVKALTGTIVGASCAAQDRSDPAFINEFSLGSGVEPYDKGYYLPFNRIVASDGTDRCTPAPSWNSEVRDMLDADALKWPTVVKDPPDDPIIPVIWRKLGSPDSFDPGEECDFVAQYDDGLIDRLKATVRFGLMTFDPKPYGMSSTNTAYIGTGVNTYASDYASGVGDMWSYFPNWLSSKTGAETGWLDGCESPTVNPGNFYEVGARNPGAPPWEGRLIGFGDPAANVDRIIENNARVQQAILAMRPFGGTPIAGMLADALEFLTVDATVYKDGAIKSSTASDTGGADFYGGAFDPVVSKDRTNRGCRRRIAILITDGGPNLDLRPHCDVGSGKCPYDELGAAAPESAAAEALYTSNVDLFVVGFSVTSANAEGATLTCKELMSEDDPANPGNLNPNYRDCSTLKSCTAPECPTTNSCAYGHCVTNPEDELLAVCCNLDSIARAGSDGERGAYWAESSDALIATLSDILKFPPSALTRTQPIFATGNLSASNPMGSIDGAQFFSSFDPISDDLYAGHLVRERYSCATGVAKEEDIKPEEGDWFEANLDADLEGRTVYTVVAAPTAGVIESARSIRPLNTAGGDELGAVGGTLESGKPIDFVDKITPGALFGDKDCSDPFKPCCPAVDPADPPDAAACRTWYLNLQLGLTNSDTPYSRSSAFGAMINSTPQLVMPPSEYLRDVSYEAFQTLFAERPPMIYAATADGQLHAFVINKTDTTLNELWSFMPPAVLPGIREQFPTRYAAANRTLLSGPIVVGEVAGIEADDSEAKGKFLTRKAPNPDEPGAAQWYTVLLGTFGSSQGYFALDVTNPDPDSTIVTETHYAKGPRFLWQLTTDAAGHPLFGSRSTRPAIATLYFKMPGDTTAAQHAVAILPGGHGGVATDTEVDEVYPAPEDTRVELGVTPRLKVRQYVAETTYPPILGKLSLGGARSLTIVRLDTGEVIRTFRRPGTWTTDPQAPEGLYTKSRITAAPFSAPITGHIVSYPNGSGTVADRAYVGDAEGRLWRIDLSSAEPQDWSVDLFHDAYPSDLADPGGGTFNLEDIGPIETPPIISTDPVGRVTINISTGEQTMLNARGKNSVWSLTERTTDEGKILAHVNWVLNGDNAKNPGTGGVLHFAEDASGKGTGERVTGPMALFASTLYFTTYDPGSADPLDCSPGNSYLWGVHYIQAGEELGKISLEPKNGPMPQLTDPDSTAIPPDVVRVIPLDEGLAFGVGVMQKPSCMEADDDVTDPFLGYGTHKAVTSVNPGTFQLIVQLGANQTTDDRKVKVDTIDLEPPFAGSTIDAWAAILD